MCRLSAGQSARSPDGRSHGGRRKKKIHLGNCFLQAAKATVIVFCMIMSTMQEPNGHSNVQNLVERENRIARSGEMFAVFCGPLLNYRGMSDADSKNPIWHGSVLIVTNIGDHLPVLELDRVASDNASTEPMLNGIRGAAADNGNGITSNSSRICSTVKLYSDQMNAFWRFDISVPLGESETRWQYLIPNARYSSNRQSLVLDTQTFVVPAANQSMRIMFHSCNGFSVGTDEAAWSGPALWNDVLRVHKEKPFHVMVGGGDQIYNDGIRVDGPLRPWTSIHNPIKRQKAPFGEELSKECDKFYCDNYIRWFSTEPFATANGQIPQVNIWDDHGGIIYFAKISHTNIYKISSTATGLIHITSCNALYSEVSEESRSDTIVFSSITFLHQGRRSRQIFLDQSLSEALTLCKRKR